MFELGGLDLTILLVALIATLLFGACVGRRTSGVSDFLVAGRSLPTWAVLLSIVATETSTVTFLSIPGKAYTGDWTFLQLPLGYCVGRLAVSAFLLPLYVRGEALTAYEVLGTRFGGAVKPVASALFLVARNAGDGLRLFLSALVLQKITGVDLAWAVLGLGALTIFYTVVGGMRAVVWMDCIQFAVYVLGAFLAAWCVVDGLPEGWGTVRETVGGFDLMSGKTRVFDLTASWSSATWLVAGLVGGAFLTCATHGADQMMVQRCLCAKSLGAARVALSWSGLVVFAQFALFLGLGTLLWVFFEVEGTTFERADEVFAAFLVDHLRSPPGALGFLLAALFAASMSTLSSSLHASAASLVRDLWPSSNPADDGLGRVRRWTVVFGVVQICVGIGARSLDGSVVDQVLGIAGLSSGLLLGLFFLALGCRRANAQAALTALSVGAVAMIAVRFGTSLAWPWYAAVGSVGTFVVGWLVSRTEWGGRGRVMEASA